MVEWASLWELPINLEMCSVMHLGSGLAHTYNIGGTNLQSYTRLYVDEFESLLAKLVSRLGHAPTHLAPISPRHRLAVCPRYLGHGSSFAAHSHNFNLGRSTVAAVVYETCRAIMAEFWKEAFPVSVMETWRESAAGFDSIWGYPRGVGALG
ncbi:hypothetical protein Aduo_002012 [Ancylostoma duodenale]